MRPVHVVILFAFALLTALAVAALRSGRVEQREALQKELAAVEAELQRLRAIETELRSLEYRRRTLEDRFQEIEDRSGHADYDFALVDALLDAAPKDMLIESVQASAEKR